MQFTAQGVFKTGTEMQFDTADLTVEVVVENGELDSNSLVELYKHTNTGAVDGFIIDLGNDEKLHMIKV